MELSIIIVTYNSSHVISDCVSSIIKYINIESYEIIVIDNHSSDVTIESLKSFPTVRLILNNKNHGYAFANNQGFQIAEGDYVLILNPDVRFTNNTNIRVLLSYLNDHQETAIVAPKLLYENGRIQESARSFPSIIINIIRVLRLDRFVRQYTFYTNNFISLKSDVLTNVDWVIGAFMMMPSNVLKELNYFDNKYFMYYEDVDLCFRAQSMGYVVTFYPAISAIHCYERESVNTVFNKLKFIHICSMIRFFWKRWRSS